MRTAQGVLDELRALDPETGVSLHLIHEIINSGAVPVVAAGKEKLVPFDTVCNFLVSGYQVPAHKVGSIRKINQRRMNHVNCRNKQACFRIEGAAPHGRRNSGTDFQY